MTLVVQVEPVAKPRMTRSDKWNERACVMEYRAYCDVLRFFAKQQKFTLPACFDVTFQIPMPKSWSGKKRALMDGQPHQQKPDIDNLLKGVMDALLDDDAQVWLVKCHKRWGRAGCVTVLPLEDAHDAAP